MKIIAVWACFDGIEKVIAIDGKIPWHYRSDMRRFKFITQGSTVVVGRKTYETFPKKTLPNRKIVVISRDPNYRDKLSDQENHYAFTSIDDLADPYTLYSVLKGKDGNLYVIGGCEIYKLFFNHPTLMPDYILQSRVTDKKITHAVVESKGEKTVFDSETQILIRANYLSINVWSPDDEIYNDVLVLNKKNSVLDHLVEGAQKSFSTPNSAHFIKEN